jgi:D-threo-aldose 1-dehydrogenase
MPDPAEPVALAGSGLAVSRLGLGTAPLGNLYEPVGEAGARATVLRALDHGIRLVDTAPLYGHGLAERRVGAALAAAGPGVDVVVSTKVGRVLVPVAPGDDVPSIFRDVPPSAPVFDFSHDGVLRSLESSLERLGRDRVDVLLIHDPDDHWDQARHGAYEALNRLRSEGVVTAIGAGMNQAEMLARFVREVPLDCVLVAGRYTLLDQRALAELLPVCEAAGVAVIVGGVFNSGLLADPRPGAPFDYGPAPADVVEHARRLAAVCAAHDTPLAAAALQFPLGHPAVTTVLTGTRSPAELDENVALFRRPVPEELWEALAGGGLLGRDVPVPA